MSWIDWLIVVIPIILLLGTAFYSKKYVRGIADFLMAGRIARRYVLSVGDMTVALSVITLIAIVEQNYQTGFSVSFWSALTAPVGTFLALTGFVVYRWRQTRCLSFGQFIELRYGSKTFRIFCAVLRTMAELITNAIGPAIAANFFIYFLGLPHRITIWGVNLPCFAIVLFLCLALAVLFIWPGGRISLLITDCFQGLLCYPIFVIITGYILLNFSWGSDIAPAMCNHVPNQSFINPYDISDLRDFNLFAIMVTICGMILNRGGWIGNDTTGAAITPHEQKMAGVLGAWRVGLSWVLCLCLAIIVITFMSSPNFFRENRFGITNAEVREQLSERILTEVVPDDGIRQKTMSDIRNIAGKLTEEELTAPVSQQKNMDTPYFETVQKNLGHTPDGRYQYQKFRSLFSQMMLPVVVRNIFPIGMCGMFCLLCVMLLISTDDGRIFNTTSTLTQDVILPLFKKRLPPKIHLMILRGVSVLVAISFFIIALFFSQLDYILMFVTIMCSLWLGGAAPIVLFGLYSRFGNLVGAWCAIIFGSGTSLLGLLLQRNWALSVYPFLEKMGWVESIDSFLTAVSSPFNPWVKWTMDPVKFPINSYEIYFISMLLSIGGYVIGSYLTYKPYNLDKLLHRGIYANPDEPEAPAMKWSLKNVFSNIVGITQDYTAGDKVIAYGVFFYSFVYQVCIAFVGVLICNIFWEWPTNWWSWYFWLTSLIIPIGVGIISTIWFMIGGAVDSCRLFRDLATRVDDPDDNGQVL